MRKLALFVCMVFLLSGCVILQSERSVQTVRIPYIYQDGAIEVPFEPRAERGPWEVAANTVSIPQIITAAGDSVAEVIKAWMLPLMGRDVSVITVISEHRRFVWCAKEPLPPLTEPEKMKLDESIVAATFGPEEEE